ncbi:MAG: tyrosine-type recombinase/integrase [Candidatus Wallbacteria bacterium]|nr:tyrosine-type recombinase/integrase [Candidatus Wallbacteria bacterium]
MSTNKSGAARTPPKQMARRLARLLKKERLDYHYAKKVFAHIRQELGFRGRPPAPKRLPELLTEVEMGRFYEAVWDAADRTHTVMIKLLLFTGIRNAELAALTLGDVDPKDCTLRIRQGKGAKDRLVPFPHSFRGELGQYVSGQREQKATYLFETNRMNKFTTRWIRALVKRYAETAGIKKRIYPHLFRHQLLTHLAKKGVVDAKLQVVSGHASRKSLETYQDLSLADIAQEYQEAMKEFPIR